jgi:hypothetical protein
MLRVGPHKVTAAIRRLERYDLIACADTTIAVRLALPALPDRLLRQLPDLLAARYRAETTPRATPTAARRPFPCDHGIGRP